MKRNYFVCCLIALFGSLNMQAYDFEANGIYYTVTDTTTVSAKVAVAAGENLYEGNVAIPASVTNDGKVYSVTSIDTKAFYYCSGLTGVTLPETVKEIGSNAFRNCSGLTTLSIPAGVTTIGYSAFFGCTGLTSINIPSGVTAIEPYTFFGCKRLPSVNLSGISKIGGSAFSGCTALSSVTIPANIGQIESYTFQNCSGLKTINIPEGVANIGDAAFQGCTGLTSITIPEGVAQIGRAAFEGCTSVTAVNIPSTVKSIVNSSFEGCTSLTSLSVASGNPIYDSRDNCNAIIETYVENKQGETVTHYKLIAGCNTSVIPDGVTEIGTNAFKNCKGLTGITIPASVSVIGVSAFQNTGLTSIVIPESVSAIDEFCFAYCENLTTVTLPATITKVEDYAFLSCKALKDFYCFAETCPTATKSAFISTPIENATLHVPEAAVGAYTLAEPWNLFSSIVAADGNLVSPEKDSETAIASLQNAGKIQQVYSLGGQQTSRLQRGINIVRLSDGTTRKVLVR